MDGNLSVEVLDADNIRPSVVVLLNLENRYIIHSVVENRYEVCSKKR